MTQTIVKTRNDEPRPITANTSLVGGYTDEDIELIRQTVAKDATGPELKLFLRLALKYDLDPFAKQIWCIKLQRNEPPVIFASHDGFIKVAHQNDMCDGIESDVVYSEGGELIGAWASVWKKGSSHPFTERVTLAEYGRDTFVWRKYPESMLKKVARVHAIKLAFSLSGLYSPDEFQDHAADEDLHPQVPHRTTQMMPGNVTPMPARNNNNSAAALRQTAPAPIATPNTNAERPLIGEKAFIEGIGQLFPGLDISEVCEIMEIKSFSSAVKAAYPQMRGAMGYSLALQLAEDWVATHPDWQQGIEGQVEIVKINDDGGGEEDEF